MLRQTAPGGNLSGIACPSCGCRGDFGGHGRYSRWLVILGACASLQVRRVRCRSCGATHAVLPEGVVPYRAYSEGLVLAVLAAWAHGMSNSQVRDAFGISESTRRRILSSTRRRVCALLACGASRSAVEAAMAGLSPSMIADMHASSFRTRVAENVRLSNSRDRRRRRAGPST